LTYCSGRYLKKFCDIYAIGLSRQWFHVAAGCVGILTVDITSKKLCFVRTCDDHSFWYFSTNSTRFSSSVNTRSQISLTGFTLENLV